MRGSARPCLFWTGVRNQGSAQSLLQKLSAISRRLSAGSLQPSTPTTKTECDLYDWQRIARHQPLFRLIADS